MPHYNIPKGRLIPVFPPGARVKYKDIFDLKTFYDDFHEYLMEHDWADVDNGQEHWETYYDERINKDGLKELRIFWRCWKKAPNSTYLSYYLDLSWKCLAIVSTEIVLNGQKFKVNKGEVEITVSAFIDKEYEKEFAKSKILGQVKKLFTKRIYKKILKTREKELYQEVYAMFNWLKQYFKLKRYLPYEETSQFFGSQAWPSHKKER